MQKLYLHIGTEKTGSTSIQRFLTANASVLLSKHGVLWPQDPKVFRNFGHFPLAGALLDPKDCDFIPKKNISNPSDIVAALSAECDSKRPQTTIMSAEHFSSKLSDANIAELSRLLGNFDVTILVYVRRQDNMALSYFSTGVRYGRRNWISPAEVNPTNFIYDIRGLLDTWARHFGKDKIKVRPYEPGKLIGGDVIADLLSVLGIGNVAGFQISDVYENTALTIGQIKLLLDLNKHLPRWNEAVEEQKEDAYRTAQVLREHAIRISGELESFIDSSKISTILSLQDRQEILERFSEDNRYIARTYLGTSKLFDDPA